MKRIFKLFSKEPLRQIPTQRPVTPYLPNVGDKIRLSRVDYFLENYCDLVPGDVGVVVHLSPPDGVIARFGNGQEVRICLDETTLHTKAAATTLGRERTPDTENVEMAYVRHRLSKVSLITGHHEFTRWLETVRAEAKAEALREAAGGLERGIPVAKSTQEWLRDRAEQFEEGS